MTPAEIIAAAREIVTSQSWPEAKAKLCEHGQSISAELLRLHDGAEALRAALKMTAEECGGVIIERDRLALEVKRLNGLLTSERLK